MDDPQEKTVFVPRSSVAQDLFNPGDVVGQYKVERVLGKGGMGVVYLVQHTALKKQFALKALPAVLAQEPAFVARFKREAEMLARLKHNHIVNVTDFGENKGRLYLVLEYVDGGSLEEWFEKHRQPDRGAPAGDVKRLISQILLGLVHAHEAGVIHRDLKPANVLLEKSGEAKISDFGLARAVADEEYRRGGGTAAPFHGDSVTTTGAIVGTIDFMSPEARNMRPSDRRSDVYAVGVIAYYLLTGKKPHGMAQPATKVVPGLDPAWDKFIATCLAEDPTKRYQSALEAHEAIRQIGQSRRGPLRWVALLAAVAAVGVGVGVWKVRSDGATAAGEGGAAPVTTAPAGEQAKGIKTGTEQLPSETNGEPKQESAALRRFTLTGLPAGAVVTYHERNFTVSPTGSVVLALPAGAQPVKVKAPGYQDWEGEIAANEADKEGTVPLQLMPPHTVHFTGLPPKAQLTVDGHTVTADATGAAVVELRPGKFALSAAAPKYEALTQSVDIEAATETLVLTMQKLPPPPEVMVTLADGTPLKFKLVPAGSAELGSTADERGRQRNDLPRSHTEFAQPFYLAETEMTQRQHRSLMGKNPSGSRAFGDETRPVEQVAWRDIVGPGGVVEKLNEQLRKHGLPYRADLPTEAEWEYACRAGTTTAYNDGNNLTDKHDDPALNALAFYGRGSTQSAPSPVAKHKPNAWGLYDMHGNVSEWAYGPRGARDPVVRGGNWKVGAEHCRSASRVELTPDTRPTDAMGYRLALHPIED